MNNVCYIVSPQKNVCGHQELVNEKPILAWLPSVSCFQIQETHLFTLYAIFPISPQFTPWNSLPWLLWDHCFHDFSLTPLSLPVKYAMQAPIPSIYLNSECVSHGWIMGIVSPPPQSAPNLLHCLGIKIAVNKCVRGWGRILAFFPPKWNFWLDIWIYRIGKMISSCVRWKTEKSLISSQPWLQSFAIFSGSGYLPHLAASSQTEPRE